MGALLVMSLGRRQHYCIVCDDDNNYTHRKWAAGLGKETIVETIKELFLNMEEKGHQPKLNVTNNQAAKPLKAFLKTKECYW